MTWGNNLAWIKLLNIKVEFNVIQSNVFIWIDFPFWVVCHLVNLLQIIKVTHYIPFRCLGYTPLGVSNLSERRVSTYEDLIVYSERQTWEHKWSKGLDAWQYAYNFQIPNDTFKPCRVRPWGIQLNLHGTMCVSGVAGISCWLRGPQFPHNLIFQCCLAPSSPT